VNAVATRERKAGRDEIAVLVWNYHDDDVTARDAAIQLNVEGLSADGAGKFEVEEFRMDGGHSNAYAVWQKMGSPAEPTTDQQKQLEAVGGLQQMGSSRTVALKDGVLPLSLTLPRQGVELVRVSW
jgi:xylan 1,4-beta-xylosidase